jgi:hypothetical protein
VIYEIPTSFRYGLIALCGDGGDGHLLFSQKFTKWSKISTIYYFNKVLIITILIKLNKNNRFIIQIFIVFIFNIV